MNAKFKKVIVDYLLKDLMPVEIIYYKDSIWFINREKKYWYFEYHNSDKHLWWRWSYFQSALKIFSLNGEEHQSIFGELVNMILNKKQILETKYPDRIFKTVGSILNFKEEVKEVLNREINTTDHWYSHRAQWVEEALNCEVKTTPLLEFEVADTVEEVLNHDVETIGEAYQNDDYVTEEILNNTVNTYSSSELVDEEKLINSVLNYGANTIEIKTINKLRGENPLQDIVVSHILDESDKVTDKLKIVEDDMTYGHNVFMCDFLVQNVLEIGSNSINFDTTSQQGRVDGVLKNT